MQRGIEHLTPTSYFAAFAVCITFPKLTNEMVSGLDTPCKRMKTFELTRQSEFSGSWSNTTLTHLSWYKTHNFKTHSLRRRIVIVDISFISRWKCCWYKAVKLGQWWHLTSKGLRRFLLGGLWSDRLLSVICNICWRSAGPRFNNHSSISWRRGWSWVAQCKKCISRFNFVCRIFLVMRNRQKVILYQRKTEWNNAHCRSMVKTVIMTCVLCLIFTTQTLLQSCWYWPFRVLDWNATHPQRLDSTHSIGSETLLTTIHANSWRKRLNIIQ